MLGLMLPEFLIVPESNGCSIALPMLSFSMHNLSVFVNAEIPFRSVGIFLIHVHRTLLFFCTSHWKWRHVLLVYSFAGYFAGILFQKNNTVPRFMHRALILRMCKCAFHANSGFASHRNMNVNCLWIETGRSDLRKLDLSNKACNVNVALL